MKRHLDKPEGERPLKRLAIRSGALPNGILEEILKTSARKGDKDIIALLLKARKQTPQDIIFCIEDCPNIDAKDDLDGETALFQAVKNGHKEVVEMLINAGADIDKQDTYGNTALLQAAYKGYKEIVELLLEKGADVNIKSNGSDTALLMAVQEDYSDIIDLLLKNHADINVQNGLGDTPLIEAAASGNARVVMLLLKKGANIRIKNKNGDTALMAAFKGCRLAIVRLLEVWDHEEIKRYLENPQGYAQKNNYITNTVTTTLMLASIFGHTEVISLYEKCSDAYFNAIDVNGCTAFDYALKYDSAHTLIHTFGNRLNQVRENKKELLEDAIKKKSLLLIAALLGIGAQPPFFESVQANSYLKLLPKEPFAKLLLMLNQKEKSKERMDGLSSSRESSDEFSDEESYESFSEGSTDSSA